MVDLDKLVKSSNTGSMDLQLGVVRVKFIFPCLRKVKGVAF